MIIEKLTDIVLIVGAGSVLVHLLLIRHMIKLKRKNKWTDSQEIRMQNLIVSFRALASILMILSIITLIGRMVRSL